VPYGNVFSAGDVLIAIGVVVTIAAAMGARLPLPARRATGTDAAA
jgi:hypothetical protein